MHLTVSNFKTTLLTWDYTPDVRAHLWRTWPSSPIASLTPSRRSVDIHSLSLSLVRQFRTPRRVCLFMFIFITGHRLVAASDNTACVPSQYNHLPISLSTIYSIFTACGCVCVCCRRRIRFGDSNVTHSLHPIGRNLSGTSRQTIFTKIHSIYITFKCAHHIVGTVLALANHINYTI